MRTPAFQAGNRGSSPRGAANETAERRLNEWGDGETGSRDFRTVEARVRLPIAPPTDSEPAKWPAPSRKRLVAFIRDGAQDLRYPPRLWHGLPARDAWAGCPCYVGRRRKRARGKESWTGLLNRGLKHDQRVRIPPLPPRRLRGVRGSIPDSYSARWRSESSRRHQDGEY